MFRHFKLCIGTLVRLFRSRQGLLLENLALRQQLAVLKRRTPRPSLGNFDRLFWVVARRLWSTDSTRRSKEGPLLASRS